MDPHFLVLALQHRLHCMPDQIAVLNSVSKKNVDCLSEKILLSQERILTARNWEFDCAGRILMKGNNTDVIHSLFTLMQNRATLENDPSGI